MALKHSDRVNKAARLAERHITGCATEELKQGAFRPEYKGQMELYLRWLAKYETEVGEETPLGIILCAGKNTEQIELLELGSARHSRRRIFDCLTSLRCPPGETAQCHRSRPNEA